MDEIPDRDRTYRGRKSKCAEIFDTVRATPSHKLAITAETVQELDRTYKSLIQWRKRSCPELGIKKSGQTVYVWVDETP